MNPLPNKRTNLRLPGSGLATPGWSSRRPNGCGSQPSRHAWITTLARKCCGWQTSSAVLVRLGETEARSYKLQVGFRQNRWAGGFGIYFAGRKSPGPYIFNFQLLDLRLLTASRDRNFTLSRSMGAVWSMPGANPKLSSQGFASSLLPRPLGNEEHLLEIEVKPDGLAGVRWHGDRVPGTRYRCRQPVRQGQKPAGRVWDLLHGQFRGRAHRPVPAHRMRG